MKVLEISLVPDYSRRLAVYLTLPVSALWLTYICHIGLGGSSRSANGPVRLTLDISHSPCQWEVCIVFVCLLVSLLVRYKTPGPSQGLPCTCSECGPGTHPRHVKSTPPTPMALAPISPLGSNTRLLPPLHSDLFLTSRPMSLYQTRAMALLPPSPSIALQAGPSTLAAAWASGPPSLSPHPASDFRSKILAPLSQFHPGFPYTASLSTLARPLYKGPPPPPAHGPSTRSSLVA